MSKQTTWGHAFYDLLRISVATARLGRSSLHLDYRVIKAGNGQEIFTARMVMVQVDLATETSRPWSTAFREALIGYHGQQVIQLRWPFTHTSPHARHRI